MSKHHVNDDLFLREAYYTAPLFVSKQKNPEEDGLACQQELDAFTLCEIENKQNAADECAGIREVYIQCQRNYNQEKKQNEEHIKLAAQAFYFGDSLRFVNIPSKYDVETAEKRKY